MHAWTYTFQIFMQRKLRKLSPSLLCEKVLIFYQDENWKLPWSTVRKQFSYSSCCGEASVYRFFCDPVHVSRFSWQDTGTLHGWDIWQLWEKSGFWWKTVQCTHVAWNVLYLGSFRNCVFCILSHKVSTLCMHCDIHLNWELSL